MPMARLRSMKWKNTVKTNRLSSGSQKEIWTIGHSTHSIEEFLEWLAAFSIVRLADVRSLPGSAAFPQFNQDRLRESLEKNGIEYSYFKDLGGRRKYKADSKNTIWRNKSFRAYADYMETIDFKAGLKELKELAGQERTAVMCAEAVWWRCHRSMIADALKAEGWEVRHIMGAGKATEHPYTKPAKIKNGRLYYGPKEE